MGNISVLQVIDPLFDPTEFDMSLRHRSLCSKGKRVGVAVVLARVAHSGFPKRSAHFRGSVLPTVACVVCRKDCSAHERVDDRAPLAQTADAPRAAPMKRVRATRVPQDATTLHVLPGDLLNHVIFYLSPSVTSIAAASRSCRLLRDAVRMGFAKGNSDATPPAGARRLLLPPHALHRTKRALHGTIICGGGDGRLIGASLANGMVRLTGHNHFTGLHVSARLEIRGVATLVGCHVEHGITVMPGAELHLAHCTIVSTSHENSSSGTQHLGVRVASLASLHAAECTFRTAARCAAYSEDAAQDEPTPLLPYHIMCQRSRAITLRGCTFSGRVVTCVSIGSGSCARGAAAPSTRASCMPGRLPLTERIEIVHCTFQRDTVEASGLEGRGGLALRLSGMAPSRVKISHNRWKGRNLTIAYGRGVGARICCEENDFADAALLASGAALHVCIRGDLQLPTQILPTRGVHVWVEDREGKLLCRISPILGVYQCIQTAASLYQPIRAATPSGLAQACATIMWVAAVMMPPALHIPASA